MRVRVKFRKYGPIRFIGHLDVMRFFQKAIRRAEIDIAYTSGFSPHQIMSFAAPLGVGLESNGEYMDIELHSTLGSKDLVDKLNLASVPGIEITQARLLPKEAGNAMASVAAAEYDVRIKKERISSFPGAQALLSDPSVIEEFMTKEQILVTKKTKRGTQDIDLKPGIYSLSLGTCHTFDGTEEPAVHMLVDASSSGNLKPSLIIGALLHIPLEEQEELAGCLQIIRQDTYTFAGEGENKHLVPFSEIGTDILGPLSDEMLKNAEEESTQNSTIGDTQ